MSAPKIPDLEVDASKQSEQSRRSSNTSLTQLEVQRVSGQFLVLSGSSPDEFSYQMRFRRRPAGYISGHQWDSLTATFT